MIFLKALNSTVATVAILNTLNAFNRSQSTGDCCDIRYCVFETGFADCLTVFGVVSLSLWCIDYEAYILIHNQIHYIRTTNTDFVYNVALNSICVVEVGCSLSSNQCKAKIFNNGEGKSLPPGFTTIRFSPHPHLLGRGSKAAKP